MSTPNNVKLTTDQFGLFIDKITGQSTAVTRFTWSNSTNVSVQVITYGATITSIKMPDKKGVIKDIVMGFNDMEGYQNSLNPYFGATVGRVANRIGQSKITIEGITYSLSANLAPHQLHGGFKGFDKANWEYYVNKNKVVMSYYSKDLEEGFPGDLVVNVSFELTENNEFRVEFKAHTTKPTFVNLTNHSYFNLAGEETGASELYKHVVSINADYTTEVDKDSIPTGNLLPVTGTIFDLRTPTILGDVIHKIPGYDGYDHNFCLNKGTFQKESFVAKISHPCGRILEVYSNQYGVQFYVSNGIPDNPENPNVDKKNLKTLKGKQGNYYKHGALCLETQNYPDAVNHSNFPNGVLYPGEEYLHTVVYKLILDN